LSETEALVDLDIEDDREPLRIDEREAVEVVPSVVEAVGDGEVEADLGWPLRDADRDPELLREGSSVTVVVGLPEPETVRETLGSNEKVGDVEMVGDHENVGCTDVDSEGECEVEDSSVSV
jgi:hypothetical protein